MISPQPGSFYLSGVRVGPESSSSTTFMWRFTAQLPVGNPGEDAKHALSVLSEMVQAQGDDVVVSNVSHNGLLCDLRFPHSSLVRVANASTAPYGVWISTRGLPVTHESTVLLTCAGQSAVPWPLHQQARFKTDDFTPVHNYPRAPEHLHATGVAGAVGTVQAVDYGVKADGVTDDTAGTYNYGF